MSKDNFRFTIGNKDKGSMARSGQIHFTRGIVKTPVFMPIGTIGSVKGLTFGDLEKLQAEIILGNTYHLWLRPGMEVMQRAGGLHDFNAWQKPILTDSGGFQAFSLGSTKFSEEGVEFKSHIDGKRLFLSPEYSIQIQANIGSDIMLVLDQALAARVDYAQAKKAMLLTRRWAERSQNSAKAISQYYPNLGVLFGIPQGAQFLDLRKESARMTMELNFPGYSIGGVANGGEPEEIMYSQVLTQTEILEENKPRHLLGVGTPKDLVQMVARGIDMFDCVQPTRIARHGSIYIKVSDTEYQNISIKAAKYSLDFSPINPDSKFLELRTYTKAYLRHLFKAKELLAYRLATLQNLEFYINLMSDIRSKIEKQEFSNWWQNYTEIQD